MVDKLANGGESTETSPKELERSPEARSYSVEHLLQLVQDGKVRVPRFQRGLKWTVADAKALLDSIYRGYPIGTLLFWQRPGDPDQLTYGSVQIQAPRMTDALWVVDGQQRITTLVRVLLGSGLGVEKFTLFFNPEKQRFEAPRRIEEIARHFVPLNEVLDSERLLEWLFKHPEVDRKRIIYLGKRIREYQMPAYLVVTQDEDAVREIYRRTNSTGKQMKPSDVFNAIYGARIAHAPSDLRGVHESLSELGFGAIEEDLLHRMMLATLGTDVSKKRLPKLSGDQAQKAIRQVERAARAVISFLRRDAGVPHIDLLPYNLTIITLARFFHLHPEPSARSRELLARWFWRGAVTGSHSGDALLVTPGVLKEITGNESESVQGLLRLIKAKNEPLRLDEFSTWMARCKILTVALNSLGPRSIETGELIELVDHAEGHALVALPILKRNLFSIDTPLLHGLENRLLHPEVSGGLRKALTKMSALGTLSSHAIPEAALEALKTGNYEEFLRLRTPVLRTVVDNFVDQKVRWDESDRPPLQSLVISDKDDSDGSEEG